MTQEEHCCCSVETTQEHVSEKKMKAKFEKTDSIEIKNTGIVTQIKG